MNFLGFLAPLLGIIMEWIYKLIPSYGWTLIIFTLLTKILMFPLSVKQQKSTARMSAYQPMMQEIQKKWANDKNRQQEELMKFQQETGMSMTAGCLPMAVNFLVLFGLIEVVYRPLQYILRVPKELIERTGHEPDGKQFYGSERHHQRGQILAGRVFQCVQRGPDRQHQRF